MPIGLLVVCLQQKFIEIRYLNVSGDFQITHIDSRKDGLVNSLKMAIKNYLSNDTPDMQIHNMGVLITENILGSSSERKEVYDLILSHFQFRFLEYVPNPLIYCFGTEIPDAIVMDIDENCLVATPVCQFKLLDENICISTRGSEDLVTCITDDDRTNLYKSIFGTNDEKEYEQNDLSICMMIDRLKKKLPIDIRKSLTGNIVLSGNCASSLLEYTKTIQISFNIKTIELDVFRSCALKYGTHLLKEKCTAANTPDGIESTCQDFNENLDSMDWYESNFS